MRNLIVENKGFLIMAYLIMPIILILSIKNKDYKENILSKSDSQSLKAISAIFIVLHHLSQRVGINLITLPFIEIGKYSVALFLFLSGYGVMSSYINNKNYLDVFLRKRILTIYTPFIISNIIFIIIYSIKGKKFSLLEVIEYTLGINLIDGVMWFIFSIIIFYIIFYIAFKFTTIKRGIINLIIGTLVYLVLGIVLDLGTTITNISFAFAGGSIVAIYKEKFFELLQKKYVQKNILLICILIITRIISILCENIFLREVILSISTLSYALLLVSLSKRFELNGKIVKLLGGISFEIYLLHNKLITIIPNINKSIVIAISYFLILIIFSYIFNKMNSKINKHLVNKPIKSELKTDSNI